MAILPGGMTVVETVEAAGAGVVETDVVEGAVGNEGSRVMPVLGYNVDGVLDAGLVVEGVGTVIDEVLDAGTVADGTLDVVIACVVVIDS